MVRKGTKKPRKLTKTDRFPLIEKALRKRTKADLVQMILMIARDHGVVARELERQLAVEKPVDLLIADVSFAIDRATDFDERMMNYNFDVEWQAYEDVQSGLSQLVGLGHLEDAMSLALKLMKDGSYARQSVESAVWRRQLRENPTVISRTMLSPVRDHTFRDGDRRCPGD